MSAAAYCREMRVVQAFSWMNFCLFVIAFFIILSLISQAQRFGRPDIWDAPIRGALAYLPPHSLSLFHPSLSSSPYLPSLPLPSPLSLHPH